MKVYLIMKAEWADFDSYGGDPESESVERIFSKKQMAIDYIKTLAKEWCDEKNKEVINRINEASCETVKWRFGGDDCEYDYECKLSFNNESTGGVVEFSESDGQESCRWFIEEWDVMGEIIDVNWR